MDRDRVLVAPEGFQVPQEQNPRDKPDRLHGRKEVRGRVPHLLLHSPSEVTRPPNDKAMALPRRRRRPSGSLLESGKAVGLGRHN